MQAKRALLFVLFSTLTVSASAVAADSPSSKLSDPEIASVVVAANTVDIDAGKLAEQRSSNPQVKSFAKKMQTDHSSVIKQSVDLVTRLNVTPKENELSRTLIADGEKTREHLKTLQGSAFDKAYVDNEVAYHEAVIDVIKTKLIPEATNSELKNLLVKVSPAFVEHLNHAKMLQTDLNKAG